MLITSISIILIRRIDKEIRYLINWIFNLVWVILFSEIITTCPSREETTAGTKTTEAMSNPSSASTAEDSAPKTKPSNASPSATSSTPHPKKILRKPRPSRPTSSPSSISRCSTVSPAVFTPESWRWDQMRTERTEILPQEFNATPLANLSLTSRRSDHPIFNRLKFST